VLAQLMVANFGEEFGVKGNSLQAASYSTGKKHRFTSLRITKL